MTCLAFLIRIFGEADNWCNKLATKMWRLMPNVQESYLGIKRGVVPYCEVDEIFSIASPLAAGNQIRFPRSTPCVINMKLFNTRPLSLASLPSLVCRLQARHPVCSPSPHVLIFPSSTFLPPSYSQLPPRSDIEQPCLALGIYNPISESRSTLSSSRARLW